MRVKRKLTKGEIQLKVGNGEALDVQAIGTVLLRLNNGCNLALNDCYFVPSLVR